MRGLRIAPAALATLGLVAGCVGSTRMASTNPSQLSPTLAPLVFFQDGAVLFVAVDARAAQLAKQGPILPLGLGLANRSKNVLTIDRESFVLEAEDGKRYPLVSIQEFNRDYDRASADRKLAEPFLEALQGRFGTNNSAYSFVDRPLFPDRASRQTALDKFELNRNTWTHLYLYFPFPENGLHGKRFKLLVGVKEVPETSFVVDFEVR